MDANEAINEFRGTVFYWARRCSARRLDSYQDLVQEGQLGVLEALRRYRPGGPAKLGTVVYHWVRHFVIKAAWWHRSVVPVSQTVGHRSAHHKARADVGADFLSTRGGAETPEEQLGALELAAKVRSICAGLALEAPDADIMKYRLLAEEETSLRAIGDLHGFTRQGAAWRENRIRKVLKAAFIEAGLQEAI